MADDVGDLVAKAAADTRELRRLAMLAKARRGELLGESVVEDFVLTDAAGVPELAGKIEVGFAWIGDDPEDVAGAN